MERTHPPQGLDRIRIHDMVFQARHGCGAAEREVGATFRVNVTLFADLARAAESDHLEDTIDVTEVYEQVREVMLGPARNLLENLADAIADLLLRRFARLEAVTVRILKFRAPLAGPTGGYEVELTRRRG